MAAFRTAVAAASKLFDGHAVDFILYVSLSAFEYYVVRTDVASEVWPREAFFSMKKGSR